MSIFTELQKQHEALLAQLDQGRDIASEVLAYIKRTVSQSDQVIAARQRDQLRANLRFWATYMYEQTGKFPNTKLRPPVEQGLWSRLSSRLGYYAGLLASAAVLIALILIIVPNISDPILLTPTVPPAATAVPTVPTPSQPINESNLGQLEEEEALALAGHTGVILQVAISPDNQMLATASTDSTVRLWDLQAADGHPITLTGHEGWVQSVAFSPNGRFLATGGNDATVRIWQAANASLFTVLRVGDGFVFDVAFSPDNQILATASGNSVALWQVNTGEQIATIPTGIVPYRLAFNPAEEQEQLLAIALNDGSLVTYALSTGQTVCKSEPGAAITDLTFAPNGLALAYSDQQGQLTLYNAASCVVSDQVSLARDVDLRTVAYHPTEPFVAVGARDGTVAVWPLGRGNLSLLERTPAYRLDGNGASLETIVFSPNGRWLIAGNDRGAITVWRVPE